MRETAAKEMRLQEGQSVRLLTTQRRQRLRLYLQGLFQSPGGLEKALVHKSRRTVLDTAGHGDKELAYAPRQSLQHGDLHLGQVVKAVHN